jgi:hypothetical protein
VGSFLETLLLAVSYAAVCDYRRCGRAPSPYSGVRSEHTRRRGEELMADREDGGGIAGISLGGIIVIVGVVLMFVWSFLGGLIVVLVGLIAFGGFARGRWY